MTQEQTLAILWSGESVFLTGPAGSGKTYVLNQFIKEARARGKSVAVTASTGLAATHLGGSTIHSWAGIGIHDELPKRFAANLSQSRTKQLQSADILIIDEVSMLHDYRFDMVDEVCRTVRQEDAPFGGLQVVLSGDFFQLPPVNRADSRQGGFITESAAWQELDPVICYLDTQYRQDDDVLLDILTSLRANDIRRRHAEALLARKKTRTPFDDPVTELYTRNIDVDEINQSRLAAVEGEVHSYDMQTTGRKNAIETLRKSCIAPEVLELKVGAFVMFVKNALDKKYVNGTLGHIVRIDEDSGYPVVQTRDDREILVLPDTWELRDGEKKVAGLTQLPLRLAWAITVHKSQGMTLDAAHIDLGNAFVPGMGYVALSRVRSLDTLSLGGLNRTALMMHEEAYEIDERLRRASSTDSKRFDDVVAKHKAFVKEQESSAGKKTAAKTEWAGRLAKMREKHPNAYRPWKPEDDDYIQKAWDEKVSVAKIAKKLGRHEGSIKKRLEKHFGEDVLNQ